MIFIRPYLLQRFLIFSLGIFFLFYYNINNLNAQSNNENKIEKVKISLKNQINDALASYNYKKVLTIGDSIVQYGKTIGDKGFEIYGLEIKSEIFLFQNKISEAKSCLKSIMPLLTENQSKKKLSLYATYAYLLHEEEKLDSSLIILNLAQKYYSDTLPTITKNYFFNKKEITHLSIGNIDSALYYSFKRLEILKPEDTYHRSNAYSQLANIFYDMNDYDKSLEYVNKAIEITNKDKKEYASISFYSHKLKSDILLAQKDFKNAELYAKKALELDAKNTKPDRRIYATITLVKILMAKEKYDEAKKLLNSLNLDANIPVTASFNYYETQMDLHLRNNELTSAGIVLNKMQDMLPLIKQLEAKKYYYQLASKYWEKTNDYKKKGEALVSLMKLTNEINRRRQIYTVYDLEKKYLLAQKNVEIEKQKNKIKQQKIRNSWAMALSTFSVIGLIGGFLFFRQRQKLKNRELENLKTHETLSKLESLIEGEEKERNRLAQDLHDGLNSELAVIKYKITSLEREKFSKKDEQEYNSAIDLLDDAIEQVRHISHNLAPPLLKNYNYVQAIDSYCSKLNELVDLNIEFQSYGRFIALSEKEETAIYRIVQELLNNIVQHAHATEVIVQINNHQTHIYITVEDNGKGYDTSLDYDGLGLKNIQSRIAYLKADFSVESYGGGTISTIDIPVSE